MGLLGGLAVLGVKDWTSLAIWVTLLPLFYYFLGPLLGFIIYFYLNINIKESL